MLVNPPHLPVQQQECDGAPSIPKENSRRQRGCDDNSVSCRCEEPAWPRAGPARHQGRRRGGDAGVAAARGRPQRDAVPAALPERRQALRRSRRLLPQQRKSASCCPAKFALNHHGVCLFANEKINQSGKINYDAAAVLMAGGNYFSP